MHEKARLLLSYSADPQIMDNQGNSFALQCDDRMQAVSKAPNATSHTSDELISVLGKRPRRLREERSPNGRALQRRASLSALQTSIAIERHPYCSYNSFSIVSAIQREMSKQERDNHPECVLFFRQLLVGLHVERTLASSQPRTITPDRKSVV